MSFVETMLAITGSLASIAGLIVAWIQTTRLREIKRIKNFDTWMAIRETLTLVRELDEKVLPAELKDNPTISSVSARVMTLHRDFLRQAVLDEKDFDDDTIFAWMQSGKIKEKWQESFLRQFIQTPSDKKKRATRKWRPPIDDAKGAGRGV